MRIYTKCKFCGKQNIHVKDEASLSSDAVLCDVTTNDIEIILDALHQYISICRKHDNKDIMDDTIKLFLKLKKD